MQIRRYIQKQIEADLGKGKALLLFGARQVGKTTLVNNLLRPELDIYLNADQAETRDLLETTNLSRLSSLVRKYERVVIDEAQRIKGVGLTLKILIDNFKDKDLIVTGSSSFELANKVNEELTGRKFNYHLLPIAELELAASGKTIVELGEEREERLILGSYPEVVVATSLEDKQRAIKLITESYIFKDILTLGLVKDTGNLERLLRAIAFQIGSEVSLSELATVSDLDRKTIARYLNICEQAFIIFALPPLRRNRRSAISKMKKYYFYDLGIRNALVRNFNLLEARDDFGALWENYCIIERMKRNSNLGLSPETFFLRDYSGKEVDYIEYDNDKYQALEFKYRADRPPKGTTEMLKDHTGQEVSLSVVNKDNILDHIL